MKLNHKITAATRIAVFTLGMAAFLSKIGQADLTQTWLPVMIGLIALIRLADIELPQGDVVTLDGALIVAGLLLFDLPTMLVAAGAGLIITAVARQEIHDVVSPLYSAAQRSLVIFLAGLATAGRFAAAPDHSLTLNVIGPELAQALALCATFFLLELAFNQLALSQRQGSPFIPAFLGSFSLMGSIYFSLTAVAILIVLMYPSMNIWSVVVFGLPLIIVHYVFKLFLDIKDTYKHTISALTRAIQVEDYHQKSHSERVADLAVDIGKEIGFFGDRLEALGYAALLHDIGKLGMDIDSFDALLDTQEFSDDIAPHAQMGAEILERVDFLRPFAEVVRKHHLPYTSRRNIDQEHPIEARIVTIANYFDRLTQTPLIERRLSTNQAVARIKREGDQFDPKLVRALVNVLRKKNRLIVTHR